MNPSSVPSRTTQFLLGMTVFVTLLITGCGGGGGNGASTPPSDPNRVGAGWITITGSNVGTSNTTSASTVRLWGDAFISPTWWGCCSGSATDTGVSVSWTNATTGVSGAAIQTVQYCWFLQTYLCNHQWQATIDLSVGNNVITITAADPSGNLGRVTTTVTRTPDTIPPVVQTTSPVAGASAVGTNSAISVTFSEAMNPASISAATILLKDNLSNLVSGGVAYSNRVATFTPASNLQGLTSYTVTVTTGVRDVAGNALATPYILSFTTGIAPDTTPPTVSSTSPSNGATCVPTESQINAAFSEALLGQTVDSSTFLLKDSQNNSVSLTAAYAGRAIAYPNSTLANSTNYSGTLTTGITDLAGNHLAADYTWSFTTQAAGGGMWNAVAATSTLLDYGPAVWTGTEMIIWGGSYLAEGARYNPITDSWISMSTVGAPSARFGHVAVWIGSKMIVWGGIQPGAYLSSGAIYDPSTDSWTPMSTSGAPSGRATSAVWTGSEMIIWGGDGGGFTPALGDGARYNPSTDTWTKISSIGAPVGRSGHTAIWNGSAMIVWGGQGTSSMLGDGGIYTPSSDSWSAITNTGAPTARSGHVAIWSGTEMIIWGGWDGVNSVALNTGARYNPSSNSWQSISTACAPLARYGHLGVWTGTELLVWGGGNANGPYYSVGGRYNPITDSWQALSVVGMPSVRMGPTGIWTGTDFIVWGGNDLFGMGLNNGGRFHP